MDVTWTDWSRYRLRDAGKDFNPIRAGSTEELDDTFTCRLGMEYIVILDNLLVPLRCGTGYDPAPGVDGADDFYTVNLGMGMQIKERVNLDFAYEFRLGNDVNEDPLSGVNGSQDVRQHRLMASMIYYF